VTGSAWAPQSVGIPCAPLLYLGRNKKSRPVLVLVIVIMAVIVIVTVLVMAMVTMKLLIATIPMIFTLVTLRRRRKRD
jgi:hypothetical protein